MISMNYNLRTNCFLDYQTFLSVTSSQMVCDVSMLHVGYISEADEFSVFVHTERLVFVLFSLSVYLQKHITDQLRA